MSGGYTHRLGLSAWRKAAGYLAAAAAAALGACAPQDSVAPDAYSPDVSSPDTLSRDACSLDGAPFDGAARDGAPLDTSSSGDASLASDLHDPSTSEPAPSAGNHALVRCSDEIIASRDAPGLPPARGAFTVDPAFAEVLGARRREEPLRTVVASAAIPVYADGDRAPDALAFYFQGSSAASGELVLNQGAGGWRRRPDFVAPSRCFVQTDLVGDEAWDLVCQSPGAELTVYEGGLSYDGASLDFVGGARHVIRPLHRDGSPASIDVAAVQSVRVQDVDGDGLDDLLVPTFREGIDDWLLLQRPGWTWEAVPFHRGFSFATCALDADGDYFGDLIYVYEEGGEAPSRASTNALYAWDDERGRLARYRVSRALDPTGWFGMPDDSNTFAQTPMSCAQRTLSFVGRPSYWLSQDDAGSVEVVAAPDGCLCDLRADGYPSSSTRHHWAALSAGFRGVGEDLVIATDLDEPAIYSADRGCDELGCRTEISDPATGEPEQQLGDLAALRGVGPLAIHDMDGDAWPDLLVGFQDLAEPPRILHNRLERNPGQSVVCLELFGRNAAGARIDVDDGVDVHTVSVGNTGNPWLSPSPVAFVGVHGDDLVSVRVARDRGRQVDDYEVTPGACYWLFPRGSAVLRE